MSQIQELHKQAMDLAEAAFTAKLRGDLKQANEVSRQAFDKESQAAALIANQLDAEPTRSVLHRSAATLAIDCGELQAAERLIAIALSGNPPQDIAQELKDLFIKINLRPYLERHGLTFDEEKLRNLTVDKQSNLAKELLRSIDEDGAEYFTIKTTGQSGMSQSGLARFVDTTPAAISRLIDKVRLSDPTVNNLPPCLKPFAGMRLAFAEYSDTKGRVIVEDTFCAAVVEYYAKRSKPRQPRGNVKAQQALRLIQHLGMRVFIHQKTGWNKALTGRQKRLGY
ncbi:MAG: hypothetical protein V7K14_28535 [Nostoc sp.]|uniref:hypothetical protein n=1 Tax=Nostoc sp. TaxID=1180 RepID=UPI002FF5545D